MREINLTNTMRLIKRITTSIMIGIVLIISISASAQETELEQVQNQNQNVKTFQRKGKILLEMNYGRYLFAGGTGFSFTSDEDIERTSIAFDGGYFVGENFAITFALNYLDEGFSLNSLGIGFKQYFSSKVPFDFSLGRFSSFGDGRFYMTSNLGYSILLAKNISLEPAMGMFYFNKNFNFNGKISFALFL